MTSRTVWPSGTWGIGVPATQSGPMRPDWVSRNESHTASSATSRPRRGLGTP